MKFKATDIKQVRRTGCTMNAVLCQATQKFVNIAVQVNYFYV